MAIGNIIDGIIKILDKIRQLQNNAETKIALEIKKIKRMLMLTLFETAFYLIGGSLLVAGLILFLTRFFPADLVIIFFGLLILVIALLVGFTKNETRV